MVNITPPSPTQPSLARRSQNSSNSRCHRWIPAPRQLRHGRLAASRERATICGVSVTKHSYRVRHFRAKVTRQLSKLTGCRSTRCTRRSPRSCWRRSGRAGRSQSTFCWGANSSFPAASSGVSPPVFVSHSTPC